MEVAVLRTPSWGVVSTMTSNFTRQSTTLAQYLEPKTTLGPLSLRIIDGLIPLYADDCKNYVRTPPWHHAAAIRGLLLRTDIDSKAFHLQKASHPCTETRFGSPGQVLNNGTYQASSRSTPTRTTCGVTLSGFFRVPTNKLDVPLTRISEWLAPYGISYGLRFIQW